MTEIRKFVLGKEFGSLQRQEILLPDVGDVNVKEDSL